MRQVLFILGFLVYYLSADSVIRGPRPTQFTDNPEFTVHIVEFLL